MTQGKLGELMTGTVLQHEISERDSSGSKTVLETQNLSRNGEFSDINLHIRAGEVVGITGLIGSGRTELAKALVGISPLDDGVITLNGKQLQLHSIRDGIDEGIAYVSEDRLSLGLIQSQSIADNTSISVLNRILDKLGLISKKKKGLMVDNWISNLAVKVDSPSDPVSALSGGNQQRIVLAKWLATEPKLLILDSPTVGVDVGARAGIFKIVRSLADKGLAILLITDEVSEVLLNSDRILLMADGRIQSEYLPSDISSDELESQLYA